MIRSTDSSRMSLTSIFNMGRSLVGRLLSSRRSTRRLKFPDFMTLTLSSTITPNTALVSNVVYEQLIHTCSMKTARTASIGINGWLAPAVLFMISSIRSLQYSNHCGEYFACWLRSVNMASRLFSRLRSLEAIRSLELVQYKARSSPSSAVAPTSACILIRFGGSLQLCDAGFDIFQLDCLGGVIEHAICGTHTRSRGSVGVDHHFQ